METEREREGGREREETEKETNSRQTDRQTEKTAGHMQTRDAVVTNKYTDRQTG